MIDDKNRVTVAIWDMIKMYMMSQPLRVEPEDDMTPTFGKIVDKFRVSYNIYISVTPVTNGDVLVIRYRYEVFEMAENNNNVIKQFTGSEQAYYLAMRKAIEKAFEFL